MNALGLESTIVSGLVVVAWAGGPLYWAHRWHRGSRTSSRGRGRPELPSCAPGVMLALPDALRAASRKQAPAQLSIPTLLAVSRDQLQALLALAPSLRGALAWVEAAQAEPEPSGDQALILRRRARVLGRALGEVRVALARPPETDRVPAARADLIDALEHAITVVTEADERALENRIREGVAALAPR
jgi:hypothetical protein